MSKKFQTATVIMFVVTLVCILLLLDNGTAFFKWLSIVVGTVFFHMLVRVAVDFLIYFIPEERFDWEGRFFTMTIREFAFYKKIRLRDWEEALPGYYSDKYDTDQNPTEKVLFVMCEDEIKHWIFVGAALLVLVLGPILFGGFLFFLISSLALMLYDTAIALSLRYDRLRVRRISKLQRQK